MKQGFTMHRADMPDARLQAAGITVCIALGVMLAAAPFQVARSAPESPQEQVFSAERAFAKSMADRSLADFSSHVSDEAIFFTGAAPLRGKPAVVAGWARFFESAAAPFSWAPDQVEVLQSGTLALSTGLVRDPDGKVIGRFNSVWRREAPGVWRVIFDKGSPPEPGDARPPTPQGSVARLRRQATAESEKTMPAHEKISYVEFPARDLVATKSFFEAALGWSFVDYGPTYSAFTGQGLDGGFYQSDLAASTQSGSALIVFYSERLEETQAKIESAGGRIVKPVFSFPGGRRFHFTEPSGNEFAVWSDAGT